jgi:predicted small secreted protein
MSNNKKQNKMKTIERWIELKKETPKIYSENYLVYKNGEIKISLFRGDWNMFQCDISRNADEPFVTHWMELPKKPSA